MVKKRIIPTLLLDGERVVKGVRFVDLRDVGHPVTAAGVYDAQVCDELIFLDIRSGRNGRGQTLELLQKTAQRCFMPLSVGGGVASLEDIRDFLQHGADKVVINTAAFQDPDLVAQGARKFGKQCIVVSIDYIEKEGGAREVVIDGGRTPTGADPYDQALRMVEKGAGELVLTSVTRDGTRSGCDLDFVARVKKAVPVPVIVRGGIGTLKDFADAFTGAGVDAVAAGSIFHFTDQSPIKVRTWLSKMGVDIRIPARQKFSFY